MNRFPPFPVSALLIAVAMLFYACTDTRIAGGASETSNGFTAEVRDSSGAPVPHASVSMRPKAFLADTSGSNILCRSYSCDTVTDINGRFTIKDIDSGEYAITVRDQAGRGLLIRAACPRNSIVDCGICIVASMGGVRGTIDRTKIPPNAALYVQIFGTDKTFRLSPYCWVYKIDSIPSGNYSLRITSSIPTFASVVLNNTTIKSGKSTDVVPVKIVPFAGWSQARLIGFNTTATGAGISARITGFPVLIRLNAGNFNFSQAQPYGQDLRFTSRNGSILFHQIERWDAAAQKAEIWVRADTIFGNDSLHGITMYSGNPAAPDLSNGPAVFDTARGFQGVWHLSEAGDSIGDATANHFSGTKIGKVKPMQIPGVSAGAQSFTGSSGYIRVPGTAAGKLDFQPHGTYSISSWVYCTKLDSSYHQIVSKGDFQYGMQVLKFNAWELAEYENRTGWEVFRSPATTNEWVYLTGVRSGGTGILYVNGKLATSTMESVLQSKARSDACDITIGARSDSIGRFWNGIIDEVRITSTAPDSSWIKLCYMNQRQDDKLVVFK